MSDQDQGHGEQDRGWVPDNSLDGQLAHIVGEWIGNAENYNIQVIPAPPGSTEPIILLTLRIQPRNEGDPPIEQKCLLSLDAARIVSEELRATIRSVRQG